MAVLAVQPEPRLPMRVARWSGSLRLGDGIDCYVLDDGMRVIGLASAIKATSGDMKGKISDVAGVAGLRRFLDFDAMVAAFVEFEIPGFALQNGKGMSTEWFEAMLTAYVDAGLHDALLTPKQKQTARQCQVLQRGLIRTGLDALVDEATGYQQVRPDDDLQLRLAAFISVELRGWDKTFPDTLWHAFGRLSGWKDPLRNRPKWWGKLVIWLIYDTLDPDVAEYLRNNPPPPDYRKFQQLTEDVGVKALVARCNEVVGLSLECSTIADLRDKVAFHYGTKPMQYTFLTVANAPRRPTQHRSDRRGAQSSPARKAPGDDGVPLFPGL